MEMLARGLVLGAGGVIVALALAKGIWFLLTRKQNACSECGRWHEDTNLSTLERMVRLGQRTNHYVDVEYRPESDVPWRVVARVGNVIAWPGGAKIEVGLFCGETLDAALAQAEFAAKEGSADGSGCYPTSGHGRADRVSVRSVR